MNQRIRIQRLITVFFDPQTYRNLVYEVLALPLTLFYLVIIAVGLSLGFSLLIFGIGLFFLMGTTASILRLANFERSLLNTLLGAEVPQLDRTPFQEGNLIQRLWQTLTHHSGILWRATLYFLLHILFAVLGLSSAIISFFLSFVLMLAPFYYQSFPLEFFDMTVTTLAGALGVSLLGFVLGILLLNINNLLVQGWRGLGTWLLRGEVYLPPEPASGASARLAAPESDTQSRRDADFLRALLDDTTVQETERS